MSTKVQNPASDARKVRVLSSLSGALPAEISIHPLLGSAGVALGAMIAIMNGRRSHKWSWPVTGSSK